MLVFLMCKIKVISVLLAAFFGTSCDNPIDPELPTSDNGVPEFEGAQVLSTINDLELVEISGLASSVNHPGGIWVHNDSGGQPALYLISESAERKGDLYLRNIVNRDWEDIAIGPGVKQGQTYLYVADIGDNIAQYNYNKIHVVEEPASLKVKDTTDVVNSITFRYVDGARDSETLMIDPLTKDLIIVSKREAEVGVYIVPYPHNVTDTLLLEKQLTMPLTFVVSGDISANGKEILVKTYTEVYYWPRSPGEPIVEALARDPYIVPYSIEPQGEAIGWKSDSSGYYTISEQKAGIRPEIKFYKRKSN